MYVLLLGASSMVPTAHALAAEVTARPPTPTSVFCGSGFAVTCHFFPVQRMSSGAMTAAAPLQRALQYWPDPQATPPAAAISPPAPNSDGTGTGTFDHDLPFHRLVTTPDGPPAHGQPMIHAFPAEVAATPDS